MLITLIRTGGVIPISKKAEKEVDWTKEEIKELLRLIKSKEENPGQMRDATGFELMYDSETFPINMEKVPSKYKKTFDDLIDHLKIVKS